jgi:hypothetical protein
MSTTSSSNAAARRPQRQSLRATFLAPLVIAIVSTAGLISALVGDGVWDVVSWVGLSVPVAVMVWYVWVRPRSG